MSTACLNCGRHFKGNYCPNCGQKATVKRLTASLLLHQIIHFFTHLENGFLFTSRNFLIKPGISSLNYIAGKRKEYQTPVSYFLIWTGIYILMHNAIINLFHYQLTNEPVTQYNIKEQANILFRQHFTLFIIPVIIFSALLNYLILGRPRYNFIEIVTISLFGIGTYFMMLFFADLVLSFIFKVNVLSINVFLFQAILSSFYNFWFSFDFFKRLHIKFFWPRIIITSLLITFCGWQIMIYLPIAWLYFIG